MLLRRLLTRDENLNELVGERLPATPIAFGVNDVEVPVTSVNMLGQQSPDFPRSDPTWPENT